MKKHVAFLLLALLLGFKAHSQFTASYHQSSLPFIGLNYELEKFIPEVRIGTNEYIDYLSIEATISYKFVQKEDYNVYGGFGFRFFEYDGPLIPVGINIYPFEKKNFGFQLEAAPIFCLDDSAILRGSFGIRYRFMD